MNTKLIVGALVALVVLGGLLYAFMPRCEQPEPMAVVMIQLQCAEAIDIDAFRQMACNEIHGTPDCQFEQSDREQLQALFLGTVNKCALKVLQVQNKCTDKYEAIK